MWVQSLGREDPLEEGMATHSSILARRIPWTEEPGGLQSMGLQRVGHDWVIKHMYYINNKAQKKFSAATKTHYELKLDAQGLPWVDESVPVPLVQGLGPLSPPEQGFLTCEPQTSGHTSSHTVLSVSLWDTGRVIFIAQVRKWVFRSAHKLDWGLTAGIWLQPGFSCHIYQTAGPLF